MKKIAAVFLLIISVTFLSCSESTVTPKLHGNVAGFVLVDGSGDPVSNALISTKPPTSSIVTDNKGRFTLDGVPVGNYQITAQKSGYNKGTVNISVREDETTEALIFLTEP